MKKKMGKKMFIVVLFVLLGSSKLAVGLSLMGPPKAGLDKGQRYVGLDYSYSDMDLELSSGSASATIEVETNMLFTNLGYGITDKWEGFALLGFATIESGAFDSDAEFAYGFGTKLTFVDQGNVSWGGLFQIGWFEGDDNIAGVDVEIDAYEIQIAVGPTYEAGDIQIYGGPFLHFVDGDGDAEIAGIGSGSFDLEQESEFGGYVGAQADIAANSIVKVEFQFTGDAWAVGAGIGWKY